MAYDKNEFDRFCDTYVKHYKLIEFSTFNEWSFYSVIAICLTAIVITLIIF